MNKYGRQERGGGGVVGRNQDGLVTTVCDEKVMGRSDLY